MNENLGYWEKRYAEKGGHKTVGSLAWTEERYQEVIKAFTEEMVEVFKNLFNTTTMADRGVLDFGCGICRWSPLLSEVFEGYYGTDICAAALEEANGVTQASPWKDDIWLQMAVDGVIPFGDQKFDCIWTCVCLQHIIDEVVLAGVISQFHDRLAEGGLVVTTENTSENKSNSYLAFRSVEQYKELFVGFDLIEVHHAEAMGTERHSIMVWEKQATASTTAAATTTAIATTTGAATTTKASTTEGTESTEAK